VAFSGEIPVQQVLGHDTSADEINLARCDMFEEHLMTYQPVGLHFFKRNIDASSTSQSQREAAEQSFPTASACCTGVSPAPLSNGADWMAAHENKRAMDGASIPKPGELGQSSAIAILQRLNTPQKGEHS
jgi:hypothetical protein